MSFRTLLCTVLLVPFVGCGDDTTDGGGGQGNGGGPEGGGVEGGGDQGGEGTGGAEADYAGYGVVGAYSYRIVDGGTAQDTSGAYAAFYLPAAEGSVVCQSEEIGACTFNDCADLARQPETVYVPGGTVTISGGMRTIVMDPESDGTYAGEYSTDALLFEGGDELTVSSTGDGSVPAFEASAIAPSSVTVTNLDIDVQPVIDRGEDLSVSWTGGDSGEVLFGLGAVENDGTMSTHVWSLVCRAPATDGSITVSADALQRLPATAAMIQTSLSMTVVEATYVEEADWYMSFSVQNVALTPDGRFMNSLVTLQ